MAVKKESFGLSLLDVLSNALLGGIVLMIIASVQINISNMTQADFAAGDETGESEVVTAREFRPVDTLFKSNNMRSCFIQMFGGRPGKCGIDVRIPEIKQGSACIRVSRGTYDKSFWFITNECLPKYTRKWSIFLNASNSDLPDSIHIHMNAGLKPVALDENIRRMQSGQIKSGFAGNDCYKLFTVEEGDTIVPNIYK